MKMLKVALVSPQQILQFVLFSVPSSSIFLLHLFFHKNVKNYFIYDEYYFVFQNVTEFHSFLK